MTSGPYEATAHDFTAATTRPLLEQACRIAGLDSSHVRVLRHHSNAVYLVGHPSREVVIKIGRPGVDPDQDLHDARGMVELTRWLTRHDVPTTTLLDTPPQPLFIDGHVVTLWHYLPQRHPITTQAIAAPLRALHQAPRPPITRPALDPHTAITHSVTASRILTARQRDMLLDRLDRLMPAWTALCSTSTARLLHTDPQHRNTLWRHSTGRPLRSVEQTATQAVLCDLDDITLGPVEWDLATIEIHHRRFGHPTADYSAFCRIYDRDIRDWPGYSDLRDLRELRMIATNARKSPPDSPQAAEVHRRIDELDDPPNQRWRIL
ncbi:phosphotransferase [Saccharothrix longispora]|uniref:phosphotransferase n=1 Tax=Saccharothrix longispora TaxID=33920 RepID=UPI0028FDAAC9|nr:phosphotransferase [Saccharothrix longispora]MDU0293756.1 phosphotransferase [Saccharothrix longispora]